MFTLSFVSKKQYIPADYHLTYLGISVQMLAGCAEGEAYIYILRDRVYFPSTQKA